MSQGNAAHTSVNNEKNIIIIVKYYYDNNILTLFDALRHVITLEDLSVRYILWNIVRCTSLELYGRYSPNIRYEALQMARNNTFEMNMIPAIISIRHYGEVSDDPQTQQRHGRATSR